MQICAMINVILYRISPLGEVAISPACSFFPELYDACLP
jgi:hypothetical protein